MREKVYRLNEVWMRPIVLGLGAFLLAAATLRPYSGDSLLAVVAAFSGWVGFQSYSIVATLDRDVWVQWLCIGFPLMFAMVIWHAWAPLYALPWVIQLPVDGRRAFFSKIYNCPFIDKYYQKLLTVKAEGFLFSGVVQGTVSRFKDRSIVFIPCAECKVEGLIDPFKGIATATYRRRDLLHTISVSDEREGRFLHLRWKKGSKKAYILYGKAKGLDGSPTSIVTKTFNSTVSIHKQDL